MAIVLLKTCTDTRKYACHNWRSFQIEILDVKILIILQIQALFLLPKIPVKFACCCQLGSWLSVAALKIYGLKKATYGSKFIEILITYKLYVL